MERDIQMEEQLWKDPDWDCPRCRTINMAIRDICRTCGWDTAIVSEGVMCEPVNSGGA